MGEVQAREQILKTPGEETAGARGAPETAPDLVARGATRFPGTVISRSHGQLVLHVPLPDWRAAATWLRDEEQFDQCVLLTAVDHLRDVVRMVPEGVTAERFEVVASFLSHARNLRLRAIAQVPGDRTEVASLTPLFPGVDFPEREVFDLFGLRFEGHPDLVRVLMPDDWEGHPLRKDDAPARVPVQFKAPGARGMAPGPGEAG